MSSDVISFTGKLTLQDCLDLHRYQSMAAIRSWVRILFVTVSLCGLALVVWLMNAGGFSVRPLTAGVFFLYFPFGSYFYNRYAIRRSFRRWEESQTECTASFTRDSVSLSESNSDMRVKWEVLAGVMDTPRGLLFLMGQEKAAWFWLPERIFQGRPRDREEILAFAKAHNLRVQRVS